jgi:hypothetical protein
LLVRQLTKELNTASQNSDFYPACLAARATPRYPATVDGNVSDYRDCKLKIISRYCGGPGHFYIIFLCFKLLDYDTRGCLFS